MSDDRHQVSADGTLRGDERERLLVDALEEYRASRAAGGTTDREALLQKYADVAKELAECLDGMDLVQDVAIQVKSPKVTRSVLPTQTLGDFSIVREIGRGGMGVVYEAEQLSLGRAVALKVLPFAAMLDEKQLQRFKNEAKAAATLNHPNIVPVHFVGTERGVHFYAMQLIDGHSLAGIIDATKKEVSERDEDHQTTGPNAETQPIAALSTHYSEDPGQYFESVAEIGCQIARALSHAHEQGIIHRDIKPAIVLVDNAGKPWVTDFGLARTDSDVSMTMSGDVLGTLRYMSPEQASGERQLVDDRADIYSLGATLYELATLQPVFVGANRETLLKQILSGSAQPPRQINPSIPLELETILLKAIANEPDERYFSAAAFADDLQRFLAHEPICARRPSLAARSSKWAKRHMGLVASLTLLLLVGLATASFAYWKTNQEQLKTQAALEQSEANLELALTAIDDMYVQFATRWISHDAASSVLQQEFLQRARLLYEKISTEPIKDTEDRTRAALVFERIGQIEQFLENYREAGKAYRESIRLGETLSVQSHGHTGLHNLARRHRLLAETLIQNGELALAKQSFIAAKACFERLVSYGDLTEDAALELVTLNHSQARMLLVDGDDIALAESSIRQARKLIDAADRSAPTYSRFRISRIENALLSSSISIALGELDLAHDQASTALSDFRIRRDWLFAEDRNSVRLEGELVEVMGQLAERNRDLQKAVEHFRDSLEIQRYNFQAQKEPSLFFVTTRLMGAPGRYDPRAFCDYIETQIRLTRVLIELDRPYEAENRLGQCMLAMHVILADRPNGLRYYCVAADTWAFAAEVIQSRRPDEARVAREHAQSILQSAIARFPNASELLEERYETENATSGHTELAQLDGQASVAVGQRPLWGVQQLPDIAFRHDATANSWFEAGQYETALRFFQKSKSLREGDHAYAFLRLAIVDAALGNKEEGLSNLERAIEIMREGNTHTELISLRETAEQRLAAAIEETPANNIKPERR